MDIAATANGPLGAEGGARDVGFDGGLPAAGLALEADGGAGVALDGTSGARRECAECAGGEIECGIEIEVTDESDFDAAGPKLGIEPVHELGERARVGIGGRRQDETWVVAGNHAGGGDLQGRGRLVPRVVEMRNDAALRGFEFFEAPRGVAEISAEKLEQVGQRCGGGAAGENERVFVVAEGEGEVPFVDEALELVSRMAADAGVVDVGAGEKGEAGKIFGLTETAGADARAERDAVAGGIAAPEVQPNAVGEFDQVEIEIGDVRAAAYWSGGCGGRVAQFGGRRMREREQFGGEAGAVGIDQSGCGIGERKIAQAEEE